MGYETENLPKTAGDLEIGGGRFLRHYIDPWAQAYVGVDDILCWRVLSTVAGQVVNLSLRYQGINGEIRPEFYTTSTTITAGVAFIKLIPGSEGYLLSATIEAPGSLRGQVFVMLDLQRGQGSQDVTFGQQLIAGYPGSNCRIGFPQSPPITQLDGRGATRSISVINPAPGADFSQTVPVGADWIVRAVTFQLVSSATVAARQASLAILDAGGNTVLRSAAVGTQAASLTQLYSFFNGATADIGVPVVNGGLPNEFHILGNWKIISNTANIQAADQLSAIFVCVEEFVAG